MIETRFKDTEVGRIPEDWELDKLIDKFEFRSNNTLSRDALSESGSIQDVHYGDVLIRYGSHLDVQKDEVPYISDKNYRASIYISDGDVIMADTAEDETVGKATEVINVGHHQLVSGLHTIWLHPIVQERYVLGYLGYAFNANIYHNQLLPLMQGTKVTSVSKTAVKDTSILVPSKSEQTRIAKALSNVDTLISELGKLIEKKRAIKQGAMQQLLTGKKRLRGFTEPWIEKKLGEIGSFRKGRGISRSDAASGNLPAIRYGEIYTCHNNYIESFHSFISEEVADSSTPISYGDILFAASGETKEDIGKSVAYIDNKEAYAGGDIIILHLDTESYDPKYCGYALNTRYVNEQKSQRGQGDAVVHIVSRDLCSIQLYCPKDITEQSAIASVLTSIDEEISALEAKRKKYAAIKQGMMQQLLTGKIRLI